MRFAAISVITLLAAGQTAKPDTFKLGRFAQGGRAFLGVVVDDKTVAEIPASAGNSLKGVIDKYASLRSTFRDLAAKALAGKGTGIHDLKSLDTLAPIPDPLSVLNAAVNYVEHGTEMARAGGRGAQPTATPAPAAIPGIWDRKPGDTRQNPYLFPKLQAAITGDGDPIRLPPGRDRVDWECELAVVIGRAADHVTPEQAKDYVFGYTLMNDVSDRGGRADARHGSDWLIGKSHPTFAPLGPFVVPQEFVPDPQKMPIRFTLSGKVMQESNTDRMTHSVYELIAYASNIVTLQPGDIISTGSPAGVGTARDTPIYMKAGDVSVCTIGNIGTLTNPVVAATAKF